MTRAGGWRRRRKRDGQPYPEVVVKAIPAASLQRSVPAEYRGFLGEHREMGRNATPFLEPRPPSRRSWVPTRYRELAPWSEEVGCTQMACRSTRMPLVV